MKELLNDEIYMRDPKEDIDDSVKNDFYGIFEKSKFFPSFIVRARFRVSVSVIDFTNYSVSVAVIDSTNKSVSVAVIDSTS